MPLFTFKCPENGCTFEVELLVNASETKQEVGGGSTCPRHGPRGVPLIPAGEVEAPALTSGRNTRKGGVVMKDGSRVRGEFPSNRKG